MYVYNKETKELYNTNDLTHYGIPGMKWGHRKARPVSNLDRARIARKQANKEYDKAYRNANSLILNSQFNKADNQRRNKAMMDAAKKANAADKAYKQAKKKAVSDYEKKYDKASKAQDTADKNWENAQKQYKALGKTKLTRMINAARGKSDAAKQYNKSYDTWEKSQNAADKSWKEARKKYKETGRNTVNRIYNNIKYGK